MSWLSPRRLFLKLRDEQFAWTTYNPPRVPSRLAEQLDKEPALVEVILRESREIIRTGGRALIVETHHGFICANAGVDQSNVGLRQVALLPEDPDRSARAIRDEINGGLGRSLPSLSAIVSAVRGGWEPSMSPWECPD